ncbi:hypothetical protein VTJ49DRAFT_5863 [Mycothermus thermophilus]|uniref:Uncharacterized protein n=1 Tax=Humicola insolens TaxID=85995 RepID=A0ABR3V2G2_HUMIN
MDMRDDPNTTTTTDYDSGDSAGVDYVYASRKGTEKKPIKAKSPARRRSPKGKSRATPRCTCGADRPEEDDQANSTVFEDSDTGEDCHQCKRSARPRHSGPRESSGNDDKNHHKADKRRQPETKPKRAQTPYIEEYPDEIPRRTILLREHRILLRRASTSDTKRVRTPEGRSQSSASRGRSPTGKRAPPRQHRRSSKESPKRYKRRSEPHTRRESGKSAGHLRLPTGPRLTWFPDKDSESDACNYKSESDESQSTRLPRPEPEPMPARVVRSATWSENSHSTYSSSWPLHPGPRFSQERSSRRDYDDESSDDESELDQPRAHSTKHREERHSTGSRNSQERSRRRDHDDESENDHSEDDHPHMISGKHRDERHHTKQHSRRISREEPKEPERRRERQHTREVERERQHTREPERELVPRERSPSPPPRPSRLRTVASRASMTTIAPSCRGSVATSLCEVWRGQDADWESPYVSRGSEDELDSDLDEPVRLLRNDDIPSRTSSPRLLPPRGERSEFGFQGRREYLSSPSTYTDDLPNPFTPTFQRTKTWPTTSTTPDTHLLLDHAPPTLTADPDAMLPDNDAAALVPRSPSRASSCLSSSTRLRLRPSPGPAGPSPSRGWTHPQPQPHLPLTRSRAVSPPMTVISVRRTR